MFVDVDMYEEFSSGDFDQFLVFIGYLDDFESVVVVFVEDGFSFLEDVEDVFGYEENYYDIIDVVDLRDGLELEGGSDDVYCLDFLDIVVLCEGDEDVFEGDYGEIEGDVFEGECGDIEGDGEVEVVVLNEQSCVDGFFEEQLNCVVLFMKEYFYKVKSENFVWDGFVLIKKEVVVVLWCFLEGEEVKFVVLFLLRLNFDDVLLVWLDCSLWIDGKWF